MLQAPPPTTGGLFEFRRPCRNISTSSTSSVSYRSSRTSRAAMAQNSILNALPNELTAEVISLCNSSSQAALCRVSKLFKQLAQRQLYQIVYLDHTLQVISFDATLSTNPQYGAWVRSLNIKPYRSISGILKSTKGLRQLSVNWQAADELEKFSFSHLRILSLTDFGFTESIISIVTSFLSRHPGISHLATSYGPADPSDSETMKVDLPNLTTFQGDPNILGNCPKLRSARFSLVDPKHLEVLARFPSCQDVYLFTWWESVSRIHDVLKHLPLPHLKSCIITDYQCLSASGLGLLLADELSGLKQLESLCLVMSGDADLEDRDSTIELWLKSCPSLQEAALIAPKHSETRYKIVDGKVHPTTEPCRLEKIFRNQFGF
ncbi:hypothetical protein C8J56DRAFT_421994 [Mycena floridula]|nr:hypothetical protein C8J56DRAFT_421994 [Mycena floridula]